MWGGLYWRGEGKGVKVERQQGQEREGDQHQMEWFTYKEAKTNWCWKNRELATVVIVLPVLNLK